MSKDNNKEVVSLKTWTIEQDDFLRENYGKYAPKDFTEEYAKRFPKRSSQALRLRAHTWGVSSPVQFTEEEDALIIENHCSGAGSPEIASLINERLEKAGIVFRRTSSSIRSRIRKLEKDLDGGINCEE